MDDLFAPPGSQWQSVSPRLAHVRRALLLIWVGGLALVTVVLGLLLPIPTLVTAGVLAVLVVALLWGLLLIPRNYRAWGYSERDEDLLVTHGVLFRRLAVVPYGRMQLVDVTSGPIERRLGLATIQMHTASPASDAKIPGLPSAEAARLRDRLSALGEAQAAGL